VQLEVKLQDALIVQESNQLIKMAYNFSGLFWLLGVYYALIQTSSFGLVNVFFGLRGGCLNIRTRTDAKELIAIMGFGTGILTPLLAR
jgi:hypothetical protein